MNTTGKSDKKRMKRDAFLKKAVEGTREAFSSRDMLMANISKSIEDVNKAANLLCERLEELYAIYFPELKLEDKEKYVKVVLIMDRKNPDAKELSGIVGSGKSNDIINKAQRSMGVDLNETDLAECKRLANGISGLYVLRSEYEKYLETLAKEICPNISELVGSAIAAKLISKTGSLSRLAILPSSTIQVLGAERALFKHLKNKRIDPPKHGIIFQHVMISSSPKKVRGKIARLIANKICIAAKADHFTKNFIAPQLKKDLEEHYNKIMEDYKKSKAN
jgi:nucleolar protein 56